MKDNQEPMKVTPAMLDVQKLVTSGERVPSGGEVANMVGYAMDTIISRLTDCPTLGGRVYAHASDFTTRWGIKDARTVKGWLDKAEQDGLIHPMQGMTIEGKDGDVLYNIAEVEAALKERRRVYLSRKAKSK